MALVKEQLDEMHCTRPGCDHTGHDGLMMHARCHEEDPPWAEYKDGVMTFTCSVCDRFVAAFEVASER